MRVICAGHGVRVPLTPKPVLAEAVGRELDSWRAGWASWPQVRGWGLLAGGIAAVMLVGVAVVAALLPVDPHPQRHSVLLDPTPDGRDVRLVMMRNLLVLAIHAAACYVGAIVGRPHKPMTGRLARWGNVLHREMPPWVARGALLYALSATLLSVALQTTGLGFVLLDVSAGVGVAPWELVLLVLPHAVPELIGVFLPLGLFLIQARKQELRPLGRWTWQSCAIALPLIAGAALIEVYITPQLILEAATW